MCCSKLLTPFGGRNRTTAVEFFKPSVDLEGKQYIPSMQDTIKQLYTPIESFECAKID